MHEPAARRELVSVAEAAVRLGISQTEVRRRIRAGRLEAEEQERPQGTLLRVIFYTPEDAPSPVNQPPEAHQDAPAASLREILEPLTEAHERLFEAYREIADLRERVGRAEADASHATARADSLAEQLSATDRQRDAAEARALASEAEVAALRGRRRWRWPW